MFSMKLYSINNFPTAIMQNVIWSTKRFPPNSSIFVVEANSNFQSCTTFLLLQMAYV